MKLAWSLRQEDCGWRHCPDCHAVHGYCSHHAHVVARNQARSPASYGKSMAPLVGPRVRLPQAKGVPEDAILRVLRKEPGRWFTHWRLAPLMPPLPHGEYCRSLPDAAPELAAFPVKVLVAKLASMRRRGLVDGCAHARHRGDWRV